MSCILNRSLFASTRHKQLNSLKLSYISVKLLIKKKILPPLFFTGRKLCIEIEAPGRHCNFCDVPTDDMSLRRCSIYTHIPTVLAGKIKQSAASVRVRPSDVCSSVHFISILNRGLPFNFSFRTCVGRDPSSPGIVSQRHGSRSRSCVRYVRVVTVKIYHGAAV